MTAKSQSGQNKTKHRYFEQFITSLCGAAGAVVAKTLLSSMAFEILGAGLGATLGLWLTNLRSQDGESTQFLNPVGRRILVSTFAGFLLGVPLTAMFAHGFRNDPSATRLFFIPYFSIMNAVAIYHIWTMAIKDMASLYLGFLASVGFSLLLIRAYLVDRGMGLMDLTSPKIWSDQPNIPAHFTNIVALPATVFLIFAWLFMDFIFYLRVTAKEQGASDPPDGPTS